MRNTSAPQRRRITPTDRAALKALSAALAILLVTAIAQAAVFVVARSATLFGDALHNGADAAGIVPLLIAFATGSKRWKRRMGWVVVAMIALSVVGAVAMAVHALYEPPSRDHLLAQAVAGGLGFAGNIWAFRVLQREGRHQHSGLLGAGALHALIDAYGSLAVVLSAGALAVGWERLDAVLALGTAALIAHAGWHAFEAVRGPRTATRRRTGLGFGDPVRRSVVICSVATFLHVTVPALVLSLLASAVAADLGRTDADVLSVLAWAGSASVAVVLAWLVLRGGAWWPRWVVGWGLAGAAVAGGLAATAPGLGMLAWSCALSGALLALLSGMTVNVASAFRGDDAKRERTARVTGLVLGVAPGLTASAAPWGWRVALGAVLGVAPLLLAVAIWKWPEYPAAEPAKRLGMRELPLLARRLRFGRAAVAACSTAVAVTALYAAAVSHLSGTELGGWATAAFSLVLFVAASVTLERAFATVPGLVDATLPRLAGAAVAVPLVHLGRTLGDAAAKHLAAHGLLVAAAGILVAMLARAWAARTPERSDPAAWLPAGEKRIAIALLEARDGGVLVAIWWPDAATVVRLPDGARLACTALEGECSTRFTVTVDGRPRSGLRRWVERWRGDAELRDPERRPGARLDYYTWGIECEDRGPMVWRRDNEIAVANTLFLVGRDLDPRLGLRFLRPLASPPGEDPLPEILGPVEPGETRAADPSQGRNPR